MARTAEESQGRDRPVWKDHSLHVVWAVMLMVVLGTSSVTPAFPAVTREFGISQEQVYLLITVFLIPGLLLTFVAGMISDRFGRRWAVVPSLFLFGIAGAACLQRERRGVSRPSGRAEDEQLTLPFGGPGVYAQTSLEVLPKMRFVCSISTGVPSRSPRRSPSSSFHVSLMLTLLESSLDPAFYDLVGIVAARRSVPRTPRGQHAHRKS